MITLNSDNIALISIIVPIYKVEAYLVAALDAILNQTYKHLEIILVDDGSPDNSGQICDEYAQKDKRIKVIHKENGGLSDARNAGLEICTGEFIAFVDSDDLVHPQFVQLLHEAIQKDENANIKIACCRLTEFEDKDEANISFNNYGLDKVQLIENKQFLYLLFEEEWLPTSVVVWNKLYHKSIFETLRFPVGKNHEDEYVYFEIYKNQMKIAYFDLSLYYYRIRPGSIMTNKFSDKNIASFREILNNRIVYAQNVGDKALQAKINHLQIEYITAASFYSKDIYFEHRNLKFLNQVLTHPSIYWKTKLVFLKNFIFKPFN